MRLRRLVQVECGKPFYHVRSGEYFQFLTYDEEGVLVIRSEVIYESDRVLMKVDTVGAIDYPYNKVTNENVLYVPENEIVQVVKKTHKAYRDYVRLKKEP